MMKVLWPHTFSPNVKNAGVFMFQLIEPLRRQGVDIVPVYIGGIKRNPLRFFASLPALVRQAASCDVVHAQYGSMCGMISALLPGRKVLSLRGSDWYKITGGGLKLTVHSFLARAMTVLSLPFYQRTIVMSKRMAQNIRERNPRVPTVCIPDGIDLSKFQPMNRREARRQLGIDENTTYVLFITAMRDNPIKRAELAMAALEVARKEFPDLHMLVTENIDHDRMPVYVSACNLVINTSTHEGWPNSIKEALACNVPFVATDVSDLKEIADVARSCRVVPADAQALGRAIIEVVREDGDPVLRPYVEHMDVERCAQQLKQTYESIVSRKRAA